MQLIRDFFALRQGEQILAPYRAPLRRAEDAVLVDTSAMDFDESRRAILDVIRRSVEA